MIYKSIAENESRKKRTHAVHVCRNIFISHKCRNESNFIKKSRVGNPVAHKINCKSYINKCELCYLDNVLLYCKLYKATNVPYLFDIHSTHTFSQGRGILFIIGYRLHRPELHDTDTGNELVSIF